VPERRDARDVLDDGQEHSGIGEPAQQGDAITKAELFTAPLMREWQLQRVHFSIV
jgi:hypothetical protein